MATESAIQRTVSFAFNDFVILNSESDALKFNLGEFFVGNVVQDVADKLEGSLRKRREQPDWEGR